MILYLSKLDIEHIEFRTQKMTLIITSVTKVLTIYRDNFYITVGKNLTTITAMVFPVGTKNSPRRQNWCNEIFWLICNIDFQSEME